VWRHNAGRLEKKQQELALFEQLQKDKERIARDLHDHVGGQLSFLVHALDGITDEPAEKRAALKRSMLASLRNVIAGLRETIWAIHDKSIAVTDFMDRLKMFTRHLFEHSGVQIHFREDISPDRQLSPLPALNLYRMCQEIIQNAFKHAQATQLWVECTERDNLLFISIRDNGIGFDVKDTYPQGMGLQNIHTRAAEFGIRVQAESDTSGTAYTLIV
jgi:signal transduction histidine kinase